MNERQCTIVDAEIGFDMVKLEDNEGRTIIARPRSGLAMKLKEEFGVNMGLSLIGRKTNVNFFLHRLYAVDGNNPKSDGVRCNFQTL